MKIRRMLFLGGFLSAATVAVAVAAVLLTGKDDPKARQRDPRQKAPVVLLATPRLVSGRERNFTGIVAAKEESDLSFRVPGKIIERLVNAGETVEAGQPLMRIDDADLQLALNARRNAVDAARAAVSQLKPDEQRYAGLMKSGAVSRQRYELARAALDTAEAQLAAAEADARVAQNEARYTVLSSDTAGTVIETIAEPGQVVSAGQTVIRIARAGPREAVVALPETLRPSIGSLAEARIYGDDDTVHGARLRQLSDAADPQTRTFEARYVLDGSASLAPLGATVTLMVETRSGNPGVEVPIGAILDDGTKTGVWIVDAASSTVQFEPVTLIRMSRETAVVSGLEPDTRVVALGAHLLHDGARVRTGSNAGSKK